MIQKIVPILISKSIGRKFNIKKICILSKKDAIYNFFYIIPLNLPLKKGDLSPPFLKEGLGGL